MKYLRSLILLIAITAVASDSWAYLYERTFLVSGKNYLVSLGQLGTDKLANQDPTKKKYCLARYNPILSDGVIDIRIILGYFDWTTGRVINRDGVNYGFSPSIDLGAYAALRKTITDRCPGSAEFCEFTQSSSTPYRFTKRVVVEGKSYQAKVDIYFSSVSEYLNANTGKYLKEQRVRSQAAEALFVSALQNADAVFYFGHSRNGGGPDFNPPIFISGKNKVNYNGYYRPNQPGLKKTIAALRSGPRQPSILGIMSCDSRDHFLSGLRKAAPNTGIISSLNVLGAEGVYTALIGGVDATLRGQCQTGFARSIRRTAANQKSITMDGMFE